MKKIILFAFIFFNIGYSYATEGTVVLNLTEVHTLNTPQPINEVLDSINQNEGINENHSIFELEEDIATTKFEKNLYKFVNHQVINSKLNTYSSSLAKPVLDY